MICISIHLQSKSIKNIELGDHFGTSHLFVKKFDNKDASVASILKYHVSNQYILSEFQNVKKDFRSIFKIVFCQKCCIAAAILLLHFIHQKR
jgi:hypothetical protein